MSQHSTRNSYRNGAGARPVPTSEKGNISKPHNLAAQVTSAPEPVIYGVSFLFIVFGLTFLIMGGVYIGQCELEPMVPVWLLVMGIILLAKGILSGIFFFRTKREPFRRIHMVEKIIAGIVVLFFFAWFIAGNVWIYSAWGEKPDFGHQWMDNACNKSVFFLAFTAIIVMDAIVGILVIGACFWGVSQVVVRE